MPATVEPAAHRDARKILEEHGLAVHEIHRVDPDCVLYVNKALRAVTAWLTVTDTETNTGQGHALSVAIEPGFVTERGNATTVQREKPTGFSLKRN